MWSYRKSSMYMAYIPLRSSVLPEIFELFLTQMIVLLWQMLWLLERLVEAFLEMLFLKELYVSNKIFSLFGQYCVIMFKLFPLQFFLWSIDHKMIRSRVDG